MKSKIEYKRYLFTAAFICFFWLILSWPVLAAYQIEVGLPNIPGAPVSGSDPAAYIRYFFIFGLGLVGFLAVGAIVVGGIMYMTGGTVGKVEKARQIIWGAVTGVVLLLCSYLLLYTIDPTLVNLSPFRPPSPGTIPQQQQRQPGVNLSCLPNGIYDMATKTCKPCGQNEIGDPDTGLRCIPKPTGFGTSECSNPSTCTEAKCASGVLSKAGACDPYYNWCSKKCRCISFEQYGSDCR